MVAGGAAAISGRFIPEAVWLSLPIGFMVAMILYYQSLPDIDEDRSVGKRTVASRLGQPTAIWGERFFVAITLTSIILLVTHGLLSPVALISLLTLMLAWRTDRLIRLTDNWKDLHERGGQVRLFYLTNGVILILSVGLCS
jgi:1,4-dihydroxy-2-naphthoate polyprenyltransferase